MKNSIVKLLLLIGSISINTLIGAPRFEMRAPRPDAPIIDIAPVGPLVSCNDEELKELIQRLDALIVSCCAQNEAEFNLLFVVLNELLSTFTLCCAEIVSDLNGTFTSIAEIDTTLTECCATIFQDFQGTFSVLNTGFASTFTEIADIMDTLTACCDNFQINFIGTLTALASIGANTTCTTVCGSIPIIAPVVIDVSGVYCLSNDIIGSIIINADNVTLDLNNHTINGLGVGVGVQVNAGSNRMVKNGRIVNFATGILIDGNSDTQLNDIIINGYSSAGVQANNSGTIYIDSLLMNGTLTSVGLVCTGTNNAYLVERVTVDGGTSGFIFANIADSVIQECQFTNGTTVGSAVGFAFQSGGANQCNNCAVKNLSGDVSANGFFIDDSSSIILTNCIVQNIISSAGNADGFMCTPLSSIIDFRQCSVLTANGALSAMGFGFEGRSMTAVECLAQLVNGTGLNGTGFLVTGSVTALNECAAFNCSGTGFIITSSATLLEYCESAYNDTGYSFGNANTLIGNSIAFFNSTIGFDLTVAGVSIYHCFASQNDAGTNYVGAPNVQNANTQYNHAAPGLTGPFAGANLFI